MTEKEFIDKMIEGHKEGHDSGTLYVCHKIKCDECPLADTAKECRAGKKTTPMLLDEIIRLREEKSENVETNLEHYWKCLSIGFLSHNNEAYEIYRKQSMALFDWLLAPHEEPKRYQMSQLCYDVITQWTNRYLSDSVGITTLKTVLDYLGLYDESWGESWGEIIVKDLLENAEVVEE